MGFQLGQVVRKLQKTYDAAFEPFGITPSQALMLDQLWANDGLQLKELGARAHLDPTSVNWLVVQLEKAGLAERQRDPEDRRAVRLWLTPAGRELEQKVAPEVHRVQVSIQGVLLQFMAPAEMGALERGVQILVDELPEGEDLMAAVAAEWERRMERLRRLVEDETSKGNGGSES